MSDEVKELATRDQARKETTSLKESVFRVKSARELLEKKLVVRGVNGGDGLCGEDDQCIAMSHRMQVWLAGHVVIYRLDTLRSFRSGRPRTAPALQVERSLHDFHCMNMLFHSLPYLGHLHLPATAVT